MCHSGVFLSMGRFLSEKKERARKLTPQMARKQSSKNDAKQSSQNDTNQSSQKKPETNTSN